MMMVQKTLQWTEVDVCIKRTGFKDSSSENDSGKMYSSGQIEKKSRLEFHPRMQYECIEYRYPFD